MEIKHITAKTSTEIFVEIQSSLENKITTYPFDQYKDYISKDGKAWIGYYFFRFKNFINDPENSLFCAIDKEDLYIWGCRLSYWDKAHFGIAMANISVFYHPLNPSRAVLQELINKLLCFLRDESVKFASVRINGDNLLMLHLMEESGFRYYETAIWPIRVQTDHFTDPYQDIRLMEEKDLERVMYIASHCQYKRGHFHCDSQLDQGKADLLYARWVKTAFEKNEPVVIIEYQGQIVGYFVVNVDKNLSHYLGFQYGRMKSLSLDSSLRGKGLGMRLFRGAIDYLSKNGAQVIDSGYASKNHISAKLHSLNNFFSVYEEVTLHLWL